MVFNSQEELQKGLDECVKRALEATGSPLVLAHACWGDLAKSSALRMTRIDRAQDSRLPLVELAKRHHTGHKEAFRRHIVRFGRSGTLLDWIARYMYSNCGKPQEHQRTIEQDLRFLVAPKGDAPPLTTACGSIVVSKRFFDALADSDVVMRYLNELYSPDIPPHAPDSVADSLSYAAQQLVSLRYDARRMLAGDPAGLAGLNELAARYETKALAGQERSELQWRFLGALQTGFVYVQSSHAPEGDAHGFVSQGACYVSEKKDPQGCPLAARGRSSCFHAAT